jgi:hypothetical protein
MSNANDWFVVVFKSKSFDAAKTLVDFYRFVDSQKGVQSLHFLVADRIDDDVVFSFRVLAESKLKEIVKAKSATKLGNLMGADKFSVDQLAKSDLRQYMSWFPEKKLAQLGVTQFTIYVDLLKSMSTLVVDAIEKNYFASNERVDLARIFALMLGCTEYGLLRPTGMEVGYYDRLEDKYCSYLRENFPQPNEDKKQNTDSAQLKDC